jgi:DNA-binding GntR family transcriptional regulator
MTKQAKELNSSLKWHDIWRLIAPAGSQPDEDEHSRIEEAYSGIKGMILSGQLHPGHKLVHEDLATTLEVSRTPVREALERLFQEGFVTRQPRRGFYVGAIAKDEARELYDAREAMELHALSVTLALGPISRRAINDLSEYVDRYNVLLKEGSIRERVLVDVLFHLKLAELSGNRYIVLLLARTFERITLKRRTEGYRSDRGREAADEHAQLLRLLRQNNGKEAMKLLRCHIHEARDALLNRLIPDT